ncbi:MAG: gamma-glutamylcyclotransferase [Myxococcales bacterium]|nr:gamma-glutamylcyclotransferase [Myxococcales bacterium]MDH3844409.1 gamma-glutamylcyclotransferase [Myxococcales bacterium]
MTLPLLHYVVLYFAYGSNLDADSWVQWCEAKGYDPDSIEPLGRAWLPDYEPVFHYQSSLRKSGALDVRPRKGSATPGALFRVHDWSGLDAKEGLSGRYYRRIEVVTLTDDGQAHPAVTYSVCDERLGSFVPPAPEYQRIVTRGLSRFGHGHDQFLAAARGESSASTTTAIFAYGTLMRGERSHDRVARRLRRTHHPARVSGASLVRIDWYPGLVLNAQGVVHGEVFEVDDIGAALDELDPYEDFAGYGHDDSLYRRSLVRTHTNGGALLAWTYVFLGDAAGLPVIASGRWSNA